MNDRVLPGSRVPVRVAVMAVLAGLLATIVGVASAPSASAYVGAPWFEPGKPYTQNFPDPTVVVDGSTYWAYGTSTGGSLVPAMSSTDLGTWRPRPAYSPNPYNGDPFFNDSYPYPPQWSIAGRSRAQAQWAPGVVKLQGQWVAYTSWEVSPGRRCISVARASSPMGPFIDNTGSPFVCDADPGGSIDPAPFVDVDGKAYLMWKSAGVPGAAPTKIKSRQLSPDGLSFAPGTSPVTILQTELPWEGNSIENPSMVRYQGTYWLIVSGNEWESAAYRTGQAACAGPLGPCSRTSLAPLIGNTASELSPAGGSLFVDNSGRLRIIYQVWNAPYTSYPSNPNCDGNGTCTSQGQRRYRIDGVAVAGGRLTVDPIGSLDAISARIGAVDVAGWALDPSTPSSIDLHVYVDGVGRAIRADGNRPDLPSAYPGLGSAHGFNASVPASPGPHRVCLYGIDVGAGDNSQIDCRDIVVPGASPFGSFDLAAAGPGEIRVGGWAIDSDTSGPIDVHVYVDQAGRAIKADGFRPDVGAAYPASGADHGFDATIPAGPGWHQVCAYGINQGGGSNSLLGCRTVLVPTGAPFGSLDVVAGKAGAAVASGWAIDPDTRASIPVHVYVDGNGVAVTADRSRPDVGAAYPAYGSAHGFSAEVPSNPGPHTLCAYGINQGGGSNSLIGCRTVVVPDRSPFGSLDAATAVTGGIRVAGWTIDPDTTAPITVHVYVGSSGVATVAGQPRPDVGAAYPGSGSDHGYVTTVPAGPGTHQVCAYGINVGPGGNKLLGCRSVVVR